MSKEKDHTQLKFDVRRLSKEFDSIRTNTKAIEALSPMAGLLLGLKPDVFTYQEWSEYLSDKLYELKQ